MGGGPESRCVGRVYGADGSVARPCGIKHLLSCIQAASSVLYTTSCKHRLVLLRMGEIIARNMLSWLKLLIKVLLLHLVGCLYYTRSTKTVLSLDGAVHGTIQTVHTTYAAALRTTTRLETRCRKPHAATLTPSVPDDGLMRPKHVELRKLQ